MIDRRLLYTCCVAVMAIVGCDQSVPPTSSPVENLSGTPLGKSAVRIEDEYIVLLKDDVSESSVASVASELATRNRGQLKKLYRSTLRGFSVDMTASAAAEMARDSRVRRVEQDVEISVAIIAGKKTGGTTGQETGWGITRVGGIHDGTGKRAWIIDTGIDLENADLNVDTALSENFVTKGGGKDSPEDLNGHGTHVAGVIGAKNNTVGAVGVAANATVVAIRVLDKKGVGQLSWVLDGIEYVAQNAEAGDVVNMSFDNDASATLDEAVTRLADIGVKIAVAAGNQGAFCGTISPARVDHANVFTISAIDAAGMFWEFSNFGNPPIDYAAPGVEIISTKIGGGTISMTGTSMATPHVAGLLLLGSLNSDGIAFGDTDGDPDPVAHF